MRLTTHDVDNQDGWRLDIKQYVDPEHRNPALPPILIIPGYCMNTFILAFHPRGTSLVEYLTRHGFEVFTANLRGQGDSELMNGGSRRVGLRELSLVDLPAAVRFTLEQTGRDNLHLVGCSLGGAIVYAYLAHHPETHRIASVVAMGAPLRWEESHPLLKVVFSSRRLASIVNIRGTRGLARRALPIARRIPRLLDLYMNTAQIALEEADQLVQTIDDPHPYLNVQIVNWVRTGELIVAGKNVAEGLRRVNVPLLNVFANADGIVPPGAARSVGSVLGSDEIQHLEVGDDQGWYAHADMFISDQAERTVFEPMARWLKARRDPAGE